MNLKDMAKRLEDILGLAAPAVGVKLISGDWSPDGWLRGDKLTYCQFIMKAREGGRLIADVDNISCPNGASALGLREVPPKLVSGELLETIGTFEKEAGAEMVASIPRFRLGEWDRIALARLGDFDFEPDLVLIESLPEQIMWLNLASIYGGGGRLEFGTSVSNGTCSDLTVVPMRKGCINISAGCYGCRNATSVADQDMYAGLPFGKLTALIEALEQLQQKAMPRTRGKKAYKGLSVLD